MPSSPQSRTIGTGEWSSMPTVVFRLAGHDLIGPSDSDQSWLAISFAVVPPPARNALWLPPITSKYTSPHAQWLPSSRNQNSGKTRRFRTRSGLKKGMLWTDQMGSKVKCGMLCAFDGRWPRVLASALDRETRPQPEVRRRVRWQELRSLHPQVTLVCGIRRSRRSPPIGNARRSLRPSVLL